MNRYMHVHDCITKYNPLDKVLSLFCTLQDDWLGIVHHVTGEHEWADGQCNHGQLIEAEHDAPLLQKDSKAHEAIRNVVLDPRFLNTLDHYVMFRYVSVYLWFNFYFIHSAAMAPVCLTYSFYLSNAKSFYLLVRKLCSLMG